MMKPKLDKLIFIPKRKPQANYRIFCFPYAGGSSATYIKWLNYLHEDIELACIELPGRGARFSESCYTDLETMVNDIVEVVVTDFFDKKIMFYGHSMGARVAYFVADALCQNNLIPYHMFISGSACPGERINESIHHLPDPDFIHVLKERYGFSDEVLNNPDLLSLVLPKIKTDFKIIEMANLEPGNIVPCKATILSGTKDTIKSEHLYKWKSLIGREVNYVTINGDHFFVDHMYCDVIDHVNNIMNSGVMNNV